MKAKQGTYFQREKEKNMQMLSANYWKNKMKTSKEFAIKVC